MTREEFYERLRGVIGAGVLSGSDMTAITPAIERIIREYEEQIRAEACVWRPDGR